MDKYEYKKITISSYNSYNTEINKYGQEGWEAVSMSFYKADSFLVLLKRKIITNTLFQIWIRHGVNTVKKILCRFIRNVDQIIIRLSSTEQLLKKSKLRMRIPWEIRKYLVDEEPSSDIRDFLGIGYDSPSIFISEYKLIRAAKSTLLPNQREIVVRIIDRAMDGLKSFN